MYFGTSGSGASYRPSTGLESTQRKWRYYQARGVLRDGDHRHVDHLCEWGIAHGGDMHPISLSSITDHVEAACDFGALAAHAGIPAPGLDARSPFEDLLDWLAVTAGANRENFDRASAA